MSNNFKIQEEILISNMAEFVNRFKEVVFRYEFDERRSSFLVSYEVPSYLQEDDEFWDALYSFKLGIRDMFGDDAPIFMEGESICKLSPEAKLIQFEELIANSENSFVFETFQIYTFSSEENEVCFFDGYEEYLCAA